MFDLELQGGATTRSNPSQKERDGMGWDGMGRDGMGWDRIG